MTTKLPRLLTATALLAIAAPLLGLAATSAQAGTETAQGWRFVYRYPGIQAGLDECRWDGRQMVLRGETSATRCVWTWHEPTKSAHYDLLAAT